MPMMVAVMMMTMVMTMAMVMIMVVVMMRAMKAVMMVMLLMMMMVLLMMESADVGERHHLAGVWNYVTTVYTRFLNYIKRCQPLDQSNSTSP